jgi:hypothetical protein
MILHSAPANEAVLANVGTVNSFTIKATAKSFRILSDGLYANKIRAIIRELSCNAYDSHVGAGQSHVPFEVHLPTTLEPWFAVRDFGLGLSAEQVTTIFTTFFESTKTGSNDFVGALGLGSKSPFSYTDNFTVTAVQNGQRGVYTAFINDQGVPSIAVMAQDRTAEPNGVEIKFSVDNSRDFGRFAEEAGQVFAYFAVQPVSTGGAWHCDATEYEVRDIIPGVHRVRGHRGADAVAVMGNIPYPINIPASQGIDEDLTNLLNCNLEMHFDIGELDFQASREGLSYVPQTVNAIVSRLKATAQALTVQLAAQADAIPNLWDRAVFLTQRRESALWKPAVLLYAAQNPIPTFDGSNSRYHQTTHFRFSEQSLAADYNIRISAFERTSDWRGERTRTLKTESGWDGDKRVQFFSWAIPVDGISQFVVNDGKKGAAARARYHYSLGNPALKTFRIYVLQRADNNLPIKLQQFLAAIHNPPRSRVVDASSLNTKPVAQRAQTMNIVKLVRSDSRRNRGEMVWSDPIQLQTDDTTRTFYYIPLRNHQLISKYGYVNIGNLYNEACQITDVAGVGLYGVRKGELENIKNLPNWINIEDHMAAQLTPATVDALSLGCVRALVIDHNVLSMPNQDQIIAQLTDANSMYAQVVRWFLAPKVRSGSGSTHQLLKRFLGDQVPDINALVIKYQAELDRLAKRYPMLTVVRGYATDHKLIADYINLMDRTLAPATVRAVFKKPVADLV